MGPAGLPKAGAPIPEERRANGPRALCGPTGSRFGFVLVPDAATLSHVDDMTVLGQTIDQGGGQMIVYEERVPLAEAQIGSDESRLFLVPFLHEGEEQSDLDWFDLDVPDLIDQEAVIGEVIFKHLSFGVIGHRLVEFVDQLGKKDVTAAVALIDGMNEEAGGQAGLTASGGSQPDDVLVLFHVAQRVVEGEDSLLIEFGLTLEGIGFDDQKLRNVGAPEA